MMKYVGEPLYGGIVQGPAFVWKKQNVKIIKKKSDKVELELKKVEKAIELGTKQIKTLYDRAITEVGKDSASIFDVHQMMMEDEEFLGLIYQMIRMEMVNAEYAVSVAGDKLSNMFATMDDEYMKARAIDVKDITERLVKNIIGEEEKSLLFDYPSVMVADDFMPSEILQLDKDKVLAFVTIHGSTNSHTAILARMRNIPAVVAVPLNLNDIKMGTPVLVDGERGEVFFEL